MKKIFFSLLLVATSGIISAQDNASHSGHNSNAPASVHKIVFQLSTEDTLAHKALMKQLSNITSVAPDTKIEVVCHGPGLVMLMNGKTTVLPKLEELVNKDISFVAYEFSMKERKVSKEQIIPLAGYVTAGIIEIVSKQEQGWSYIKSGF